MDTQATERMVAGCTFTRGKSWIRSLQRIGRVILSRLTERPDVVFEGDGVGPGPQIGRSRRTWFRPVHQHVPLRSATEQRRQRSEGSAAPCKRFGDTGGKKLSRECAAGALGGLSARCYARLVREFTPVESRPKDR